MLKGNRERIRGKGVGKRKSDVASIGRKLKLHLLVYTSCEPARCAEKLILLFLMEHN